MERWKMVDGSKGTRRSFTITCGLAEGYCESAKIHSIKEVIETTLEWMKVRAANGQPFLTGAITTGEVVYAWPEGEGKAGGGHESVSCFKGEVSPLYNAKVTDEEATEILNNLASTLGKATGQTRVYVAYRDELWILQKEETATPTGETV